MYKEVREYFLKVEETLNKYRKKHKVFFSLEFYFTM